MSLSFVTIVFVATVCFQAAISIESNFYYEESCGNRRGACVLKNECPETVSEEYMALCPTQKSSGAVCCKGLKITDLNCYQQHNECFNITTCPERLNLGRKGCPKNQVCCVLT